MFSSIRKTNVKKKSKTGSSDKKGGSKDKNSRQPLNHVIPVACFADQLVYRNRYAPLKKSAFKAKVLANSTFSPSVLFVYDSSFLLP